MTPRPSPRRPPISYESHVCSVFGSADFIGSDRVIFNIGGNTFRLIARVAYKPYYCVNVCFIGTHAEYDKFDAAKVKQQ